MDIVRQIETLIPFNEQEQADRALLLELLERHGDALFFRENKAAHMTASAWAVNAARDRVLMAYHNIYRSWSWMGGHADGERDLLRVALREVTEESGAVHVTPVTEALFSLEILTVDGHEKSGRYVPSHLHLNATYLLEVDESDPLSVCVAENSGVQWFSCKEAIAASTEPWFCQRIYSKLNDKLNGMQGPFQKD